MTQTPNQPAEPDPLDLLTVDDVTRLFKVTRNFVYDQVENGFLPVIRFKRHLRFRRGDLELFLQRQAANQ